MGNIEFLTEEEKDAMSVNDLAVYLDLLKLIKGELEGIREGE